MLRVVVDTSALSEERLGRHVDAVRAAVGRGQLEVLWTHVTVDELAAVSDPGPRARLLALATSVCRFVPTGACVDGFSRADLARPAEDREAAEAHAVGDHKHTRDALVAATAEVERAAVLTYDRQMRGRAEQRGLIVHEWPDALAAATA